MKNRKSNSKKQNSNFKNQISNSNFENQKPTREPNDLLSIRVVRRMKKEMLAKCVKLSQEFTDETGVELDFSVAIRSSTLTTLPQYYASEQITKL